MAKICQHGIRDLRIWRKRPTNMAKETYEYDERDLLVVANARNLARRGRPPSQNIGPLQAAWKYIKEEQPAGRNLELVVINPAFVIGPALTVIPPFLCVLLPPFSRFYLSRFSSGFSCFLFVLSPNPSLCVLRGSSRLCILRSRDVCCVMCMRVFVCERGERG